MNRVKKLSYICVSLFLLNTVINAVPISNPGTFWHITDFHLDPYYNPDASDPSEVCPSSYGDPVKNPGKWGDYKCDSPWELILSSIEAMKRFHPDPDFIIWTGDAPLHTSQQDRYIGNEKVIEIIQNITSVMKENFPQTIVYPAIGNHDYHPKNHIPPGQSSILSQIATVWKSWLTDQAHLKLNNSGYYKEDLGYGRDNIIISLNSNLWSRYNREVSGTGDPGNQFQWFENQLLEARKLGKKIFVIGHIPPGYFDVAENVRYFYPEYNARYISIVTRFSDVISGQFFGHHHTDSFRLFKNSDGESVTSMLLAPGVTPWTYPPDEDGGQNPGIRLYEYDRTTLFLKDYKQYYLDLEQANQISNIENPPWKLEYQATSTYSIDDISPSSLDKVAKLMRTGCLLSKCPAIFDKFALYLTSSYRKHKCSGVCSRTVLCAVTDLEVTDYDNCIKQWKVGTENPEI